VLEPVGRPADSGQLLTIDPTGRFIVMHLYLGLLKVIPIDQHGRLQEAFSIR
jgi:hypothetical protein